jgi:hypothetical protein
MEGLAEHAETEGRPAIAGPSRRPAQQSQRGAESSAGHARGGEPTPSDKDWVAMSNKSLNVSLAYLTGRLKIQGSHGLVKELDKIFP